MAEPAAGFAPTVFRDLGDAINRTGDPRWPGADRSRRRSGGANLFYRDFHRLASAVARGLLALGLEPGERVAILLANRGEFLASVLGAMRAGSVEQGRQVLARPAVRAEDLQLEGPNVADVLGRVIGGGGAAGQQHAANA
jgi:non-ribosomal peptide synthetase component E (peptide arylation enzyme)